MISLTLPYPPTMNTYWRNVTIGRMARTLISREGRDYKKAVGDIGLERRIRPLIGELSMRIVVYRPRRIGDLDNTLKPILDALKGIAFADDKQVVEIHATRRDDKEHPRAEVIITTLESLLL